MFHLILGPIISALVQTVAAPVRDAATGTANKAIVGAVQGALAGAGLAAAVPSDLGAVWTDQPSPAALGWAVATVFDLPVATGTAIAVLVSAVGGAMAGFISTYWTPNRPPTA